MSTYEKFCFVLAILMILVNTMSAMAEAVLSDNLTEIEEEAFEEPDCGCGCSGRGCTCGPDCPMMGGDGGDESWPPEEDYMP